MVSAVSGLAHFLADAGQVVAGGAALGGLVGFVAASLARDLGYPTDRLQWAEYGARVGGLIGLGALVGSL